MCSYEDSVAAGASVADDNGDGDDDDDEYMPVEEEEEEEVYVVDEDDNEVPPPFQKKMHWATPERAPHKSEQRVLALMVADGQYRWAVLEGYDKRFFPLTWWRTSAMKQEELEDFQNRPEEVMERYIPCQVFEIIYGSNERSRRTREMAASYRASHRIPVLSVYVLLPDPDATLHSHTPEEIKLAERCILFLLSAIPCRVCKIRNADLQGLVGDDGTSSRSPPFRNDQTHEWARAAATDLLFPGRPSLVIDGGMTLQVTATESETCPNRKMALFSKGESQDVPPADARCTWNRIVSRIQGLSVVSKLKAMHEQTGALPEISSTRIQDRLNELKASDEYLPCLGMVDTETSILACVLQETVLFLRTVIQQWAKDKESEGVRPIVCLTGIDSKILSKLIGPECADLLEIGDDQSHTWLPDESCEGLSEEAHMLRIVRKDAEPVEIEVATRPNLVFHGFRRVLMLLFKTKDESLTTDVDHFREDLVGCRVAKYFDDVLFRGQVMSYQSSRSTSQDIDKSLFFVRYDDGDCEEINSKELYTSLVLYDNVWEHDNLYSYVGEELQAIRKKKQDSKQAAEDLRRFSPAVRREEMEGEGDNAGASTGAGEKRSIHEAELAAGGGGWKQNQPERRPNKRSATADTRPEGAAGVQGSGNDAPRSRANPQDGSRRPTMLSPAGNRGMHALPVEEDPTRMQIPAEEEPAPSAADDDDCDAAAAAAAAAAADTAVDDAGENVDDGSEYVGRRIAKYFDGVIYYGTVTGVKSFTPPDGAESLVWHIYYEEDEDEEDLELYEVEEGLDLYERNPEE